jgi:hypothetical protein
MLTRKLVLLMTANLLACSEPARVDAQTLPQPFAEMSGVKMGATAVELSKVRPNAIVRGGEGFSEQVGIYDVWYTFSGEYDGSGQFVTGRLIAVRADRPRDDTMSPPFEVEYCLRTPSALSQATWSAHRMGEDELLFAQIDSRISRHIRGTDTIPAITALVWRKYVEGRPAEVRQPCDQ